MENNTENNYTDEYTRFVRYFRYIQNERTIPFQDFIFDWKILTYNAVILLLYYSGTFNFAGSMKDLIALMLSVGSTLFFYKNTKKRFYDKERMKLKRYVNKLIKLIGSIY